MKSVVALFVAFYSVTTFSVAHASGPVGGSHTPGDPSLLTTYLGPAAPSLQPPVALAPPEEPKARDGAGDKDPAAPAPSAPAKDG